MNNLGKTTLTLALVDYYKGLGLNVSYLKYPVRDLEPTGPRANAYLRSGNPENLSPIQFQTLTAQNRRDYQPELERRLASDEWVIAEDYTVTGIAWRMIYNCKLEELEEINRNLLVPDLSLLLDGERFLKGVEKGHKHESGEGSDEKWNKGRLIHLSLEERYGLVIIKANQSEEKVLRDAISMIEGRLNFSPEGQMGFGKERR